MSHLVCCCETPEEYGEAIMKYYRNKTLLDTCGKAGQKYVSENYTWDSISKSLESILIEV